jgi:hypothetical protein
MTNTAVQYPFENEIRGESAGAQIAHRSAFQGILDLNQAIAVLTGKVNKFTGTTTTTAAAGTQNVTENTTVINETVSGGAVSNQTGLTAYSTLQSDNGSILIFSDAAPVAVTLSIGLTIPWYCFPVNLGAGTVTLTPASGTINGGAAVTIVQGDFAIVFFDGTNFWALNLSAIEGEIAAIQTAIALLAPKASPTFTGVVTQPDATVLTAATTATSATAGAATALPATPLGYLQININGVNCKVPYYSV